MIRLKLTTDTVGPVRRGHPWVYTSGLAEPNELPAPGTPVQLLDGRDKPLALYCFTRDDSVAEKLLQNTSSGGASINHVMLHYAVPDLPFGGVGESGMGAYHGRTSFETFSHSKSVLKKPFAIDPSIMYPPYNETKEKWLKRLL